MQHIESPLPSRYSAIIAITAVQFCCDKRALSWLITSREEGVDHSQRKNCAVVIALALASAAMSVPQNL